MENVGTTSDREEVVSSKLPSSVPVNHKKANSDVPWFDERKVRVDDLPFVSLNRTVLPADSQVDQARNLAEGADANLAPISVFSVLQEHSDCSLVDGSVSVSSASFKVAYVLQVVLLGRASSNKGTV